MDSPSPSPPLFPRVASAALKSPTSVTKRDVADSFSYKRSWVLNELKSSRSMGVGTLFTQPQQLQSQQPLRRLRSTSEAVSTGMSANDIKGLATENIGESSPFRSRALNYHGSSPASTPSAHMSRKSLVHLLPDPACLVGDKGQVLVYNSSFERVFRSLESSPQLVFELVEASVETVVRDAVQDAYASTLPFSRQVLVSPELAWTVSSLGLKAGLAAGLEGGVFVMYSRPCLEIMVASRDVAALGMDESSSSQPTELDLARKGMSTSPCSQEARTSASESSQDANTSISDLSQCGCTSTSEFTREDSQHSLLAADPSLSHIGGDRFNRRFMHEIRTPLHLILNSAFALDQTLPEVQEVLAYATDLKGILDDYSFMNQTEQGSSSCAPVLLRPLIETLAPNATRSLLSDRTLRCSFTGQEEELLVDSQLLSRVITHLLSNATRYSPAASVIELALESNGAEVTLRVSNACLPAFNVDDIAASLHSSLALFQTYISEKERGRGSLTYSHGLGFGLACCSKMVRALGGELACSFLDDKRQVSFSFTLQLLRVESHRSLSRSVEGLKRGRRILVVDDSRVCRKVMVNKLRQLGFETAEAADGQAACSALETGVFDALLLDLHMPVMDGIEATKYIRRTLCLDIPILVLSAEQDDSRAAALASGADAFIGKPADAAEVVARLSSLLKR